MSFEVVVDLRICDGSNFVRFKMIQGRVVTGNLINRNIGGDTRSET